ncbi:MAG: MFS transporter, partial [Pseudomonadota bacterium]
SLLLIAACGLLLVIPLLMLLPKLQATSASAHNELPNPAGKALGGNWWEGFRSLATNPYLLGIAAFILLYVFINTFVYFEQKNLLADFSRAERTQILAGIDGITNLLTFGLAFFATGRIVKRLGMSTGLALMPVLVAVGFLILAFAPLLTVLLAMQVVRRGGNYGLTRPAREMLFTKVSEQDRFKAKPVIDVAVYRGGDAVSGTIFALLTDGLGLGLAAVALVGAGIAGAWAWLGVQLGRVFDAVSGKAQ